VTALPAGRKSVALKRIFEAAGAGFLELADAADFSAVL